MAEWPAIAGNLESGRMAAKPVPLSVAAFLLLTTAPRSSLSHLHPAIMRHLDRLEIGGWWIRAAHPRNYLLWRNGKVLTKSRFPVAVLPSYNLTARLNRAELDTFVAMELIRAELRVEGIDPPFGNTVLARIEAALRTVSDAPDASPDVLALYERVENNLLRSTPLIV